MELAIDSQKLFKNVWQYLIVMQPGKNWLQQKVREHPLSRTILDVDRGWELERRIEAYEQDIMLTEAVTWEKKLIGFDKITVTQCNLGICFKVLSDDAN